MTEDRPVKIAIASGKGGTGKTLISTNLFHVLRQQAYPVILVDCDSEEPNDMVFFTGPLSDTYAVTQLVPVIDENKCTFCGKCHEYCSYNAIFLLPPARIIKVLEELCHGCGACVVACGDSAITEKEVSLGRVSRYSITDRSPVIEAKTDIGVFSPVPVIKAAIREAGSRGIVILDAPPGTSCPFIQTAAAADYVVLVTEPTPFGLSDLVQSVETLKTMRKPYGVIVNRAGLGDREIYDYLEKENIRLLMEIPFSKTIARHYSNAELVADNIPEWHTDLLKMFSSIVAIHGDSHHQR